MQNTLGYDEYQLNWRQIILSMASCTTSYMKTFWIVSKIQRQESIQEACYWRLCHGIFWILLTDSVMSVRFSNFLFSSSRQTRLERCCKTREGLAQSSLSFLLYESYEIKVKWPVVSYQIFCNYSLNKISQNFTSNIMFKNKIKVKEKLTWIWIALSPCLMAIPATVKTDDGSCFNFIAKKTLPGQIMLMVKTDIFT